MGNIFFTFEVLFTILYVTVVLEEKNKLAKKKKNDNYDLYFSFPKSALIYGRHQLQLAFVKPKSSTKVKSNCQQRRQPNFQDAEQGDNLCSRATFESGIRI